MRRLSLVLLLFSTTLCAQTMVTSGEPSAVAVTMYRVPHSEGEDFNLDSAGGYALITETREIELPPGVVMIRFEGVSSGVLPATALATGVPIAEKNRDARLLSQRGLLDAFTGQAVTIRRTDKATGKTTEEAGTIRSSPENLILQTKAGFESVSCTGLDQTLLFPQVPADLTAKPTLSVTTTDQPGGKQIIALSYLASGFNWQANYVGELAADASYIDLLGWLTMVSSDMTTYTNADASAMAGRPHHADRNTARSVDESDDEDEQAVDEPEPVRDLYTDDAIEVRYHCWPAGTTTSNLPASTIKQPQMERFENERVQNVPVSIQAMPSQRMSEIIVTARRRAEMEDVGDLKLYRIPFAVTVAAHSQKQVAFLSKSHVQGELLYRTQLPGPDDRDAQGEPTVEMLYRVQNTARTGLGEPLPSGKAALFQTNNGQRMLVAEAPINDEAVGEEVDLKLGNASNVVVEFEDGKTGNHWQETSVTVSNANPVPITYEAVFPNDNENYTLEKFSERMTTKKGKRVWHTTVPANGKRTIKLRATDRREPAAQRAR